MSVPAAAVGALSWSVGRTDLPFTPGWRGEVIHMDMINLRGYVADLGPRGFATIIFAGSPQVCATSCGYTRQKKLNQTKATVFHPSGVRQRPSAEPGWHFSPKEPKVFGIESPDLRVKASRRPHE